MVATNDVTSRNLVDPSIEQATAEQATAEQATAEQATAEQATAEQATAEQATAMKQLREEGLQCMRCPLFETGRPVVWGEGDPTSGVMFVGQGPGERETSAQRPFVGPSGMLLDRGLAEVGIA